MTFFSSAGLVDRRHVRLGADAVEMGCLGEETRVPWLLADEPKRQGGELQVALYHT